MLAERRGRVRAGRARVRFHPVGTLDRDPPRQRRRRAVQLLVEEIPPARDRLHREQGRRDDVRPAPERHALPARVEDDGHEPSRDPAVDAQPGKGRQDDLDQVVLVELPLVDDVVGATTDECGHRDDDQPIADDLGILAGTVRQPDQDLIRRQQAQGIPQPVPIDGQWPELQEDGVRREIDHPPKCSGDAPYTSAR